MPAPLPRPEKSALLLSIAAALCGAFWASACLRAALIDASFPQDSRVGWALIPSYPALPMTALFLLRILRIVRHPLCGAIAWRRSSVMLAAALSFVAVFSLLLGSFIAPWALALFLPLLLMFPVGLLGIGLAFISIRRDLPRAVRSSA